MDAAVQRLVDIEEIKQLKARYFRGLDLKDWAFWRAVFTEDVHVEADGFPFDGVEVLIAGMQNFLDGVRTVHHGFMPEITITGPDEATGIWAMRDYLLYPGDGPPVGFVGYGHYHEHYMRQNGAWRIRHLVLTRLGVDPLEGGLPSTLTN
jgi:SnoaL-like domain